MEVIVSAVLLSAVMVTTVPLLGWVAAERQAADRRQFAQLEAANVMEQISLEDWNAITQQSLERIKLSEHAASYLKEARLKFRVDQLPGPPVAKRITIELDWKNRADQYVSPVRLTAFRYK